MVSLILASYRPPQDLKLARVERRRRRGSTQENQRGGIQVGVQCEQLFGWCAILGPANQLIDYRKGEESVLKWGWSGQPPLVLL